MLRALFLLLSLFAFLWPATVRANHDLPPGAIARLGTLCFHDDGVIESVAISPDGKIIASAACHSDLDPITQHINDRWHIVLWNASTGTEIRRFDAFTEKLINLTFSPDGAVLAARSGLQIRLWRVKTGQPLKSNLDAKLKALHLEFDAAGRLLALDLNGVVTAWDLTSGKALQRWDPWHGKQPKLDNGQNAEVCTFFTLSPESKRFAFGIARFEMRDKHHIDPKEHRIRLWDAVADQLVAEIEETASGESLAVFSADGTRLVTAGPPHRIWDAASGRKLSEVVSPVPHQTESLAITRDAAFLATVQNGTLRLWDNKTGRLLLERDCRIQALAFTPDGKTLVAAALWAVVRRWDVQTRQELVPQQRNCQGITALQFSADGRTLLTQEDSAFCLWDNHWRPLGRVEQKPVPSEDNCLLAISSMRNCFVEVKDGAACLRDFNTNELLCRFAGREFSKAVFSPDGRKLLLAGWHEDEATLTIHEVPSGKEVARWKAGDRKVNWLWKFHFSPDNSQLICVDGYGGLFVRDALTGKLLHTLEKPNKFAKSYKTVDCVTVTKDSRLLSVLTCEDNGVGQTNTVRVFDLHTGAETFSVTRPFKEGQQRCWIHQVAMSPDGRFVACAVSPDSVIVVLEVASGLERGRFERSGFPLMFAPDGRSLLSGERDGTVLVWNMAGPLSRRERKDKLTAKELATLRDDLATQDGYRIDDAVWTLARSPEMALPLLRDKLTPAKVPSPETLKRLLAQLDHDDFATRQAAAAELRTFQEPAEQALRAALKDTPSPEMRRALELVLESFVDKSPETLQRVRAVEVLERIGTPEARKLLDALAGGAPEARLTRETKAALGRLASR